MQNLVDLPIYDNITKRYGKYTRKVNGEIVKIVYDWFERDDGRQYKLNLTKQQYDQLRSMVSPLDADGDPLTFDEFCDVLIPVVTGNENDHLDDYAIWLIFHSFDENNVQYVQASEIEIFMHIIGKSVSREHIRHLIDKVDWDHNGLLDFNEFREFIIRGYARELLMLDITKEPVRLSKTVEIPIERV